MIDEVDRSLREWIGTVLGETPVSLAPPASEEKAGVKLYLLDLLEGPAARERRSQPLQLKLRYLVTVAAEEPEEAHRRLGELAFAALESADFEVELGALPDSLWRAFGVMPRPAFLLRVPLRRERPARPVRRVLEPLVVHTAPLTTLPGLVLGPGDIPLAGAQVELPSLGISARTDAYGRFELASVPAGAPAGTLRVRAKGLEIAVAAGTARPDDPLIIRFQSMED